jgi:peptidoglycan/LPS O-acetylase OafA/YrhL
MSSLIVTIELGVLYRSTIAHRTRSILIEIASFPVSAQFYPPLVAYTTVALGMSTPPRTFLINTGDYSYGIYLDAFPIQQAYVHLATLPEWRLNIVFALPITVFFAAFSWHCVEKHVLKLKKLLYRNEKTKGRETTVRLPATSH